MGWFDKNKGRSPLLDRFTNRARRDGRNGPVDWYNGNRYQYTIHPDGRVTDDGPHCSPITDYNWNEGTDN
jgi:hypothetical protein